MVNTSGATLIEWAVLTPLFLIIYWCIAAVLNSYGIDRNTSQLSGILASYFISLPAYCALRPFLVNVEVEE